MKAAENEFLYSAENRSQGTNTFDKSGSCGVCVMTIDRTVYIVNVGDSRALLSTEQGKNTIQLTKDHRPNDPAERKRIMQAGGKIYQ